MSNGTGISLIEAERKRQIAVEKFTSDHDDRHLEGELAGGAASYAAFAQRQIAEGPFKSVKGFPPGQTWRWDSEWWRLSEDPLRNLVKAGALIVAEIDRILRERKAT